MTSTRTHLLVLAALAVVIFVSCGTAIIRKDQQRIAIANDVYLVLPQANELNESFNAIQAIAAEYEDRSFSFEAHLEARPGRITIVALNPLGAALFSITFDGTTLEASGSADAQLVSAEYVLADVLLAHWDVDWLNQRLEGASIETAQTGDERFVTRQEDLIMGISYESADPWGGTAKLTHIERQYVLHIRTAEFTSK